MAAASQSSRSPNYRWLVFGLLAGAYLLVYFHRLSPAVVALDLMRDLAAGGALIGLLSSAYFYPYALMQLPAGLLSDSWGPRRTITVFFLLAGAASIFFGLAADVSWAIIWRVLVGLGVSMLFVPTMKILTRWFRHSEFAFMTGLLMAVGGLGALTAATPLAYLSGVLGWRGSFVAIGLATLVLAGAIWILVRNTPEELGLPTVNQAGGPERSAPPETIPLWTGMKLVLRRKSFWPLAVWFFFDAGVFFTFGGLWGGPYLMQVHGLSKPQAGHVLSMLALAMIFGSPLLSYLSDQVLRSRKKLIVGTAAFLTLLTGLLAFFPAALSHPALYVFCLLLSLCSSAIVVIGFTSAKELFPVAIAGTSVGLVNIFPFLGGALMQPLVGWLLDLQGPVGGPYSAEVYGRAFLLLFGAGAAALISAFFTEETYPKTERPN